MSFDFVAFQLCHFVSNNGHCSWKNKAAGPGFRYIQDTQCHVEWSTAKRAFVCSNTANSCWPNQPNRQLGGTSKWLWHYVPQAICSQWRLVIQLFRWQQNSFSTHNSSISISPVPQWFSIYLSTTIQSPQETVCEGQNQGERRKQVCIDWTEWC